MLNACSISCIQHPETGRELEFGKVTPSETPRKIAVIGGGPGGMKAASVAAARGHHVTLFEAKPSLGGQVQLAQSLPGRVEFGGVTTNLQRELKASGAEVVLNRKMDRADIISLDPDAVILATGAMPLASDFEGKDDVHVVSAWQILQGQANPGARVVIADWRCDWVGLGLAEKLARDGCHVRLGVNGMVPGQTIPQYARDQWLGTLHKLGVEWQPHVRLFGADEEEVYFQHTLSGDPVIFEGVDTLVTALGHQSNSDLEKEISDLGIDIHVIGDCLSPRTAEEAILEGLKVGARV